MNPAPPVTRIDLLINESECRRYEAFLCMPTPGYSRTAWRRPDRVYVPCFSGLPGNNSSGPDFESAGLPSRRTARVSQPRAPDNRLPLTGKNHIGLKTGCPSEL